MTEKYLLCLAAILISCLGVYIIWKPTSIADKLKMFYKEYPIVRYAGDNQLTSRNSIIRTIGAVLFVVGIISLFSVLGH